MVSCIFTPLHLLSRCYIYVHESVVSITIPSFMLIIISLKIYENFEKSTWKSNKKIMPSIMLITVENYIKNKNYMHAWKNWENIQKYLINNFIYYSVFLCFFTRFYEKKYIYLILKSLSLSKVQKNLGI